MQTLYDALVSGRKEYNAEGILLQYAPTPIELRAARAIKGLIEQHDNNTRMILALQTRLDKEESDNEQLRKEIESLHKAREQAVSMGSNWPYDTGSDSTSEGGVQAEGPNPSTD